MGTQVRLFGQVIELKFRTRCFSRNGTELRFLPKSALFRKDVNWEQWLLEMESGFVYWMLGNHFISLYEANHFETKEKDGISAD